MSTSRRAGSRLLRRIAVYSPESPLGFDLAGPTRYIESLFPTVRVELQPSVFRGAKPAVRKRAAERIAASRVRDPTRADLDFEPLPGEVDYELRVLRGRTRPAGVVYDSRRYTDAILPLLAGAFSKERANILVTNRLVSTYSRDDLRHHLRTVVFGFPSVVSIPGIVEAPAKPREYYLLRREMETLGGSGPRLEELKAVFRDRFLDHGDPRMASVVSGLPLQAALFHLTLVPFCGVRKCRFYNAHWQEGLITSQVTSAGFCARHARLLDRLGRSPVVGW
jgi:hypothetical protein